MFNICQFHSHTVIYLHGPRKVHPLLKSLAKLVAAAPHDKQGSTESIALVSTSNHALANTSVCMDKQTASHYDPVGYVCTRRTFIE